MSATTTVFRTEARLFTREPGALFWIAVFPSVLLGILGLIPSFRENDPGLGGRSPIDLYVAVSVLLALIMAGIQAMPPVLSGYRERGILRRLRATPVRPHAILAAQAGLHAGAASVSAALVIAVGRLAFGTPLPQNLPAYGLGLVLGLASVLALGAVVTAVAPNAKISTMIGTLVFFPTMFTAGVWIPVQAMDDWLRTLVSFTPMGAASEILDAASQGDWAHLGDVAVSFGWIIVLGLLAVRYFRWE